MNCANFPTSFPDAFLLTCMKVKTSWLHSFFWCPVNAICNAIYTIKCNLMPNLELYLCFKHIIFSSGRRYSHLVMTLCYIYTHLWNAICSSQWKSDCSTYQANWKTLLLFFPFGHYTATASTVVVVVMVVSYSVGFLWIRLFSSHQPKACVCSQHCVILRF